METCKLEETLISFKVAEIAKKKGFNIFTGKAYIDKGNQELFFTPSYTGITSGIEYHVPTQSLLQKWLDITHNIYVHVGKHTRNGLKCYSPFINNTPVKEAFFNDYDKSEEALEVGLFEALKLLPNVNI